MAMPGSIQDALGVTLASMERDLDRIRTGVGSELELQNVRAYLLNILDLLERNPGIEAASDDLYAAAKELALGADKGTRMIRLLDGSLTRFRERLAHSLPRAAGSTDVVQSRTVAGEQIRQARELLGWPRSYLATRAKVSAAAIERAESDGKNAVTAAHWEAILSALDRAGVEFTTGATPGVRLKRDKAT
jgi:hypothetical protein